MAIPAYWIISMSVIFMLGSARAGYTQDSNGCMTATSGSAPVTCGATAGYYCKFITTFISTPCPSGYVCLGGSLCPAWCSNALTSLVCGPGTQRNCVSTGYGCIPCLAGTFKDNFLALPCATCFCNANEYRTSTCSATANDGCTPCTSLSCPSNQFKGGACNEYSTGCIPCTSCTPLLTYESTPCTTATNRVCIPCATCGPGTYQSSACSVAANTVCLPCATCAAGTYETTACTVTTNRVCSPCATCAAGTYETTACTATTNRGCSPCQSGTYSAAGATSCTPCQSGTYSAAGATSCTPCPSGSIGKSAKGPGVFDGCACPSSTSFWSGQASTLSCIKCSNNGSVLSENFAGTQTQVLFPIAYDYLYPLSDQVLSRILPNG